MKTGRDVKRLFAGSQARPVLVKLYFPGHQYREPFKKKKRNQGHRVSPRFPLARSALSVRKCFEQLPVHPPRWAVPKTKLLNLGEGGNVRQPDAGRGKAARRRERVKFQNKGRLPKAGNANPSPVPSLQAREAGPGFVRTATSPPDPEPARPRGAPVFTPRLRTATRRGRCCPRPHPRTRENTEAQTLSDLPTVPPWGRQGQGRASARWAPPGGRGAGGPRAGRGEGSRARLTPRPYLPSLPAAWTGRC